MRFGLSQQRTTVVLYLWSAMFAFPTVLAAFVPFWIAIIAGVLIFILSIWVIKSNKMKVEFK
jgi:UDP-GlcNAc:undecaprenyl-phosphate GlcNAc-1-phosphate transferase